MSRLFKTQDDPLKIIDLFVSIHIDIALIITAIIIMQLENDDYRIFVLNCYSEPAKRIICEVRT